MATKFEQLAQKSLLAKQAKESGSVDEFLRGAALEKKKLTQETADEKVNQKTNPFAHLIKKGLFSQDEDALDSKLKDESHVEQESDTPVINANAFAISNLPEIPTEIGIGKEAADKSVSPCPASLEEEGAIIPPESLNQVPSSMNMMVSLDTDFINNRLAIDPLNAVLDLSIKVDEKSLNLVEVSNEINKSDLSENKVNSKKPTNFLTTDKSSALSSHQVHRYSELAKQMSERRAQAQKVKEIGAKSIEAASVNTDPKWLYSDTPAGSNYSPEEWLNAKGQGENYVFEVRNKGESVLLRLPKRPQAVVTRNYSDKKSATYTESVVAISPESAQGTLSPLIGMTWDGCLLLAPSATTTHPGSISGEMIFKTVDKDMPEMAYRIVRPESQRETLFWLYGVKGSFDATAIGMPNPQEIGSQPEKNDYAQGYEADYIDRPERPRG